ncbi:MAG: hypothetical protein HWD61_10895 [Parachlamydiaceae bacterium]|nr:MAG: hypothetical protein HWD61_10895 [Parachlamydiaceae bacterium]
MKPYSKNYITINAMQSFYKDTREYRGVGSALHEFAIQKSFQEGCGGRVQLNAAYNSDLFHFNCGYRYLNPREYTLLRGKISEMIESYLTAKKIMNLTKICCPQFLLILKQKMIC